MFTIDYTDKEIFNTYIEDGKISDSYEYLFTYDTNYLFTERTSGRSFVVTVLDKSSGASINLSRMTTPYINSKQEKLINKFRSLELYQFQLPDSPLDMIDIIFRKIMVERGFKIRKNQIELSKKMFQGMIKEHISIDEAEVGTGKTYAYIVACIVNCIYIRKNCREKYQSEVEMHPLSVISTSSIELQNAIINTYLPTISKILVEEHIICKPLRAVLRKGKDHYFCKLRYRDFINYLNGSVLKRDKELEELLLITGTFEDVIDLDTYVEIKNHVAKKINVPKVCEMGCPYFEECKYKSDFEEYREASYDFQVCNHNYYLADASLKHRKLKPLIPKQAVVVIDEAHKLIDAAYQILGTVFDGDSITELVNILNFNLMGDKQDHLMDKRNLAKLVALRDEFFTLLINTSEDKSEDMEQRQIPTHIGGAAKHKITEILQLLERINKYCGREIKRSYNLARLYDEIKTVLPFFYETKSIIYWLENVEDCRMARLCGIPTNIEERLANMVWKNKIPKVLTSGTLSDDRGFEYFKDAIGINNTPQHIIQESRFTSPFDYNKHSLLYISDTVPFPDKEDGEYINAVASEIGELVKATHGHTAILFTSYVLLGKVFETVKEEITFPLLKMEKTTNNILAEFRQSKNGVLFASGSFWEGVDFPGDILSSVIIVNLPFPVPTPVMEKKKSEYATLKRFIEQVVFPQMFVKLKQGMGRAIRSEVDTAVISILDYRIGKHGKYRKRVLEALSKYPITHSVDVVRKKIEYWKDEKYFE